MELDIASNDDSYILYIANVSSSVLQCCGFGQFELGLMLCRNCLAIWMRANRKARRFSQNKTQNIDNTFMNIHFIPYALKVHLRRIYDREIIRHQRFKIFPNW